MFLIALLIGPPKTMFPLPFTLLLLLVWWRCRFLQQRRTVLLRLLLILPPSRCFVLGLVPSLHSTAIVGMIPSSIILVESIHGRGDRRGSVGDDAGGVIFGCLRLSRKARASTGRHDPCFLPVFCCCFDRDVGVTTDKTDDIFHPFLLLLLLLLVLMLLLLFINHSSIINHHVTVIIISIM